MLCKLDLASTFLDLARIYSESRDQQRACAHAQAAVLSVRKFLPKLQVDRRQHAAIRQKLAIVERRLLEVDPLLPAVLG